jgi:hypothetical protein
VIRGSACHGAAVQYRGLKAVMAASLGFLDTLTGDDAQLDGSGGCCFHEGENPQVARRPWLCPRNECYRSVDEVEEGGCKIAFSAG